MITLFCDLDNTILYSHRRTLNVPKRVAEVLKGAEQSYITERSFNFLSSCRSLSVIPVTTRTLKQYERVKTVIDCFNCKYALTLNGAVLLINGEIDESWHEQSKYLVADASEEMKKTVMLFEGNELASLQYHDAFLSYASSPNPETVAKQIRESVDNSLVHLFFDNRKVYCTPTILTKGNAIERLSNRFKSELTFAVGDSENDISMFEKVDIPIIPSSLAARVSNSKKVIIPASDILSDAACEVIEATIVC